MNGSALLGCFISAALLIGSPVGDAASPYAGQDLRDIKALSPEDTEAYLSGKGMGFAKAAELNGYPGPSHVLALAPDLALTAEQTRRTQSLFKSMESKAIALGRPLVEEERRLDELFSTKAITRDSLAQSLTRIGELHAQLRQVHLETHLAQIEILTPAQVAKYMALRGYLGGQRTKGGQVHKH